jgi:GNAT superfamily N-acetyltransferase
MHILLRSAEPRDVEALVRLIGALADFEKLADQVCVTPSDLTRHLFGERPVIECVVAEDAGALVGFALFFVSFSTFLGKPGLYLEDLFVEEVYRGRGMGTRLLAHLASLAVARDYGRFEWSVLDWNASAIAFYEKMGATVMPDWRVCRVTGKALELLAEQDGNA